VSRGQRRTEAPVGEEESGGIQHANAFTLRLAYSNYTAKEQHEAAKKPTKHSKTI